MKERKVCLVCGNRVERHDVSGTAELLYGRTICSKCLADREELMLRLYMIRAGKTLNQ
jgi:hypothetical protein